MIKFGKFIKNVGLAFAFGPIIIALLSFPLSILLWCEPGAGDPGACAIGGGATAELVWTMGMLHWYTLLTFIPGIILAFIGGFIEYRVVKPDKEDRRGISSG
jgi:hypothetical protein